VEQLVQRFRDALLAVDQLEAEAVFEQALAGVSPLAAVERLILPALEAIGRDWERGDAALSQVYMSGRLCEALVERVLPPGDPDRKDQPRAAIAVLEDHHLLGKRIVHAVVRASGFELADFGRATVDELLARVRAERVEVLLVSVLMLPSALRVRDLCAGLRAAGLPVKVAVGGAPFLLDPGLWREVGADAMGRNAADAIALLEGWTGAPR